MCIQGDGHNFAFSRELQTYLITEIKILELVPSNPCLVHQKLHTTAKGNPEPKPENCWPPCHAYGTAALILKVLVHVPRELLKLGLRICFYSAVIMFSATG